MHMWITCVCAGQTVFAVRTCVKFVQQTHWCVSYLTVAFSHMRSIGVACSHECSMVCWWACAALCCALVVCASACVPVSGTARVCGLQAGLGLRACALRYVPCTVLLMNTPELITTTVTELSLSVDNVMVWALIMSRLGVPKHHERRVLAAGIAIALVMRVAAIWAGAAALERFSWLTYVLGGVLVLTGYKIARSGDDHDSGDSAVMRVASRMFRSPSTIAVVALGLTDIVFAVDSIPASFGITRDPATIVIANGIALAALWSLYRVVAALMDKLAYLSQGLAVVMVWLGATMALHEVFPVSELVNLAVIVGVLSVASGASVAMSRRASGVPGLIEATVARLNTQVRSTVS